MKEPVVKLVGKALMRFGKFRESNPGLFPEQTTLYPMPFFGDIRRATVLTLSLNPAWTEFVRNRNWLPGLDENALTTRLLHYFDLPTPEPHSWFIKIQKGLTEINAAYKTNTAHIDIFPLPTKFRKELEADQQKCLGKLIEKHSQSHLAALLDVAPKVRLILVIDYTFSRSNGLTTTTSDFIKSNQSVLNVLQPKHKTIEVIYAGGVNDFEKALRGIAISCPNTSDFCR